MPLTTILLSCLVATSLMTAFSYLLSAVTGKQFREPELLNGLLKKPNPSTHPAGWFIHYGVGLLFIVTYDFVFQSFHATWVHYALAGFFYGLIGIAGWYIALHTLPHPPQLDRKSFYAQLIPAHVIFGLGAYGMSYWMD